MKSYQIKLNYHWKSVIYKRAIKKLNVLINNCINIENNIKDIHIINEKIQKYSLINIKDEINFITDDNEIENFKKLIKSFR